MDWSFLYNRYLRNRRNHEGLRWQFQPFIGREHERFLESVILGWGKCFVDVGASIGRWVLPSSKYYAEVFAFEANPEIARILRRNVQMNHLKNVKVFALALGETVAEKKLWLHKTLGHDSFRAAHMGLTSTGKYSLVRTETLDRFRLAPSIIKIDTEGYEFQVLQGAIGTIRERKPRLVVETHDSKDVQLIQELLPFYTWAELHGSSEQVFLIGDAREREGA
jgi:FkbM family methyltransferase